MAVAAISDRFVIARDEARGRVRMQGDAAGEHVERQRDGLTRVDCHFSACNYIRVNSCTLFLVDQGLSDNIGERGRVQLKRTYGPNRVDVQLLSACLRRLGRCRLQAGLATRDERCVDGVCSDRQQHDRKNQGEEHEHLAFAGISAHRR
jgi:hypothetical protein